MANVTTVLAMALAIVIGIVIYKLGALAVAKIRERVATR